MPYAELQDESKVFELHGVFMKISHGHSAILFFILTVSTFGMATPFMTQAQTLDNKASTCGNAQLEGTEACDDGNTADNDGCDSQCIREIADGICGNGIIDRYEQCDDGNNTSGDNCTAECMQEFCHVYDNTTTPPTVTSYLTTLDTAYYAGVACPSDPQPVANTDNTTLTCTDGTAVSESVCVVDAGSQLKCFAKDANSETITLGTITGTIIDVEIVGTDNILVVATADNGISLVNTIKEEVMQHLTFEQAGAVKSLAISKNNGYILNEYKNEYKILKTSEIRTADVFYTFTAEEKAPLALAATLDDNTLYALLVDGSIKAWVIDSATGTMKVEHHAGVTSLTNAVPFTTGDIVVMATPDLTKTGSYKKTVLIADAANKQIVQIADLAYQAKAEVIIKDLPFAPGALTVGKDEVLITDKDLAEKLYTIDKTFKVTEHTVAGIANPDKTVTAQLCGFAEIDMLPPVKTPICDENSDYKPDSGMCECASGYSRQLDFATNEPACLPTVVLEATCPEFSTLSDAGKCQCNTGYMGSITIDADGKSILTCTASTTSVDPIKKDPSDITPIDMVKTCPDGLTYSDVTLKCECPSGYHIVVGLDNTTLTCEMNVSVTPACPDNSSFDETKKQCECTTGYMMQALDKGIACVEIPASVTPVLDKASCPENSLYNDDEGKCECIADHTADVTTNANGVPTLVCTPNDLDVPTKTEINECPDKLTWNDDLADCACEEGLVAIRDCDGAIIRCISPQDPCGCQSGDTTTTNTTINNNNNNTDVTKVINVTNTTNNTNTNVTIGGGTQSAGTQGAGTQSAVPVSNTNGMSSSGGFTDSVNSAFAPATTAAADDDGATAAGSSSGTSSEIDPNAATGDKLPDDDATSYDIKAQGKVAGGALSCSLTQTGVGTSHHEGFLGLMVLMVLMVLAILRLTQRRIY